MTKDEALRLALEALTDFDYDKRIKAIEVIKEALETKDEQRTWVGLTDEDMNNALDYWSDKSRSAYGGAHAANGEYVDMIETWRYIEAKLKEKNNAT